MVTVDRAGSILKYIDKSKTGLEIGPSYRPLCPKRGGWKVYTVDHAPKEQLVEKYEALFPAGFPGRDTLIANIEEVDFIWGEGSLAALVKANGVERVDFIVASHVIEHAPCLISFLMSLEELVVPGGVISMAVPDKRREFDFFKPLSTTYDAIEAYREKRTRHSARSAFLDGFYACECESRGAWEGAADVSRISLARRFDKAEKIFREHTDSPEVPYSDCHAWFFTPSSFELVLLELRALGYISLKPFEISGPFECEFHVHLRKAGPEDRLDDAVLFAGRTALLQKIHAELAETCENPSRLSLRGLRRKIKSCFSRFTGRASG